MIGRFEASVLSYSDEKHSGKTQQSRGLLRSMSDTVGGRPKCQIDKYGVTLRDSTETATTTFKTTTRDVTVMIDHQLMIEILVTSLERKVLELTDEQVVRLVKSIGS